MKIKICRRFYCNNTNNTIEEITLLVNLSWLIIWVWVPTIYAIFYTIKLARKQLDRKWRGPEAVLRVVVGKNFQFLLYREQEPDSFTSYFYRMVTTIKNITLS